MNFALLLWCCLVIICRAQVYYRSNPYPNPIYNNPVRNARPNPYVSLNSGPSSYYNRGRNLNSGLNARPPYVSNIVIRDVNAPASNPYRIAGPNPYVNPQPNPYVNPQPSPYVNPQPSPYVSPQPNPYVSPQPNPYVNPQPNPYVNPQPNPYVNPNPNSRLYPSVNVRPNPYVNPSLNARPNAYVNPSLNARPNPYVNPTLNLNPNLNVRSYSNNNIPPISYPIPNNNVPRTANGVYVQPINKPVNVNVQPIPNVSCCPRDECCYYLTLQYGGNPPIPEAKCSNHSNCPSGYKCCTHCCGRYCVPAISCSSEVISSREFCQCPPSRCLCLLNFKLPSFCGDDSYCEAKKEKCCSSCCRTTCVKPDCHTVYF